MSLARALVKNAKIIILDEATGEFSECLYIICLMLTTTPICLQPPWIMRPTEKSRTQLHTNLKIELFSVLHVSLTNRFLFIWFLITFFDVLCGLVIDRLRTIISYDRICVLDAGQIAVSFHLDLVHTIRN